MRKIKFDTHPKSAYWSLKNEVRPKDIAIRSHKKFLFDCPDCLHEFKASPNAVHNVWCGYCTRKLLCDNIDCQFCFNNSFAASDKAKYWSSKNICKPRDVFKYSSNKYWFNCDKCSHDFEADLGHVKQTWCSYCSNKKLCNNSECKICFEKSFASSEKAVYWSNENNIKAREVFKSSRKIYMFMCDICNLSFEKRLDHISCSKTWCTHCFNKTETKLYTYLKQYFKVLKNVKYNWCRNDKTSRKLEYDFVIPELNLIIELDGRQHFKQISNWRCPKEQLISDIHKMKCANENGYKVIRLLQEEVIYNDSNWLDTHLKPHLVIQYENKFITVDDKFKSIYDKHKDLLNWNSSLEWV